MFNLTRNIRLSLNRPIEEYGVLIYVRVIKG